MNCLEFRRQVLAEPNSRAAEVSEHRLACSGCAQFAARVQSFERDLKSAAQLDIPETLAPRILLKQRMLTRRQSFWRRSYWAIAASLVLALTFTLRAVLTPPLSLEASVLAHVEDERKHMYEHRNVSLDTVNSQLQRYGAQFRQAVATMNFASPCPMRKSKGYHMVLAGEMGPVTVLVMPGDFIEQRKEVANERLKGVVVPTSNGSMAIIAENQLDVAQIETKLSSALQFQS